MRGGIKLIAGIIVTFFVISQVHANESLPLGDVIRMLRSDISVAQAEATGEPRIVITEASIEVGIRMAVQGRAGASVEVPILTIVNGEVTGRYAEETLQTLSVKLIPEWDPLISNFGTFGLAEAIRSVKDAYQIGTEDTLARFEFAEIKYESKFVIAKEAGAKAKIVFVSADGAAESKTVNKITVKMSIVDEAQNVQ